ncbi:Rv3235 family protein [Luedemannella helvata]|uniref:Uncharacterized protein n=1 Tax=Luedemannella helvata TaxID=349315 RepID=A0ABN2K2C5_9ACTN
MSATLRVRPSERETSSPRPPIRVRPVPPLEPPTDDEWSRAGADPYAASAPTLPFPLRPAGTDAADAADAADAPGGADSAPAPGARPDGAPLRTHANTAGRGGAAPGDNQPRGNQQQTSARLAVHRFLAACLEVLGGYRPVSQLRALCAPDEYVEITRQLSALTANGEPLVADLVPRGRTPVTTRAATGAPPRGPRPERAGRPAVRRVHIGEPLTGVAEVVVLMERRQRTRAVTLRLELADRRWTCTHLRVL